MRPLTRLAFRLTAHCRWWVRTCMRALVGRVMWAGLAACTASFKTHGPERNSLLPYEAVVGEFVAEATLHEYDERHVGVVPSQPASQPASQLAGVATSNCQRDLHWQNERGICVVFCSRHAKAVGCCCVRVTRFIVVAFALRQVTRRITMSFLGESSCCCCVGGGGGVCFRLHAVTATSKLGPDLCGRCDN